MAAETREDEKRRAWEPRNEASIEETLMRNVNQSSNSGGFDGAVGGPPADSNQKSNPCRIVLALDWLRA